MKIGDWVKVTNHYEEKGKIGLVVPPGRHQFEDEVTVELVDTGEIHYFRPYNLEIMPDMRKKERPADVVDGGSTTASFHLFEVLLDSAEDAHSSSKKFYNHLIEAGLLHASKQRDYGRLKDPFANVRSSEEWGVKPWIGALIRLNDKVRRLQSLATNGALVNEAAIDSFMDICVYALIARVLYEQELEEAHGASD